MDAADLLAFVVVMIWITVRSKTVISWFNQYST